MMPYDENPIEEDATSEEVVSIICIPGNWDSWEEFTQSVITATNGVYSFDEDMLINSKDDRFYAIEFYEEDEELAESFGYAGMVTGVSEPFLEEIYNHKHVVYITGETGSLEEAWHLALAAKAILNAGGIGVKIETAGKAFEKQFWFQLLENFEALNLYQMFVVDTIVAEDGSVFSCGMHNLGYRDSIISGEEFQQAATLLYAFALFQIRDKPNIQEGNTFRASLNSPRFRISDEPNQPYQRDEMFENSFGMWRLSKL